MAAWRSASERRGRPGFRISDRLDASATSGRCDQPAAAVVRSKDAVVSGQVDSRLRHERRQSRDEIHRADGRPLESHLCRPVPVGRLLPRAFKE